ncbi:MAG: ABC transporter permease [Lactobacillaceae bacterium]|jgi:phospholipid/cholesterol/gamma-HCH transport system permease protein|nr:ABC transporter permease [Lactobacillaceae bacterium]
MSPELDYNWISGDTLEIKISGDYVSFDKKAQKDDLYKQIRHKTLKNIKFDTRNLGRWDTVLVVLLYDIVKTAKNKSINVDTSNLQESLKRLLNLAFSVPEHKTANRKNKTDILICVGEKTINIFNSFMSGIDFVSSSFKSIGRFIVSSATMRKIDFLFALEDCGYKAFPIVTLISFMVGLILGFVGAMQLKIFGAQIFVASLVAIAMLRVMGAMMTGIIMAGRTGSAYAATIGTMQVNEEIDAMRTMGIPVVDFLLLPRVMALMLMMPLLTVFSDIVGILGGGMVGVLMLDLPLQEYWNATIDAMRMKDFLIGVFHGFVFGCIIALCGCYYGIKSGKDADSVGKATTNAVVYSIVWIIIATAVITVFCQVFGI